MSGVPALKKQIKLILKHYEFNLNFPRLIDEVDFIKRTTGFFSKFSFSVGQTSLTTRTRFLHQSPKFNFNHSTPCKNPATREMADLMFITKFKKGKRIIRKRATIVQAKFTKTTDRKWKGIDTAQLYLISKWPAFTMVSPSPQRKYQLKPKSKAWGSYVFVGPNTLNNPVYYGAPRIGALDPNSFSQQTFTQDLNIVNGFDTSPSFLMRQILCYIGEDLMANPAVANFVDDLLRMINLEPDSPDEFIWDSKESAEESSGFGVVEFTLSTPEE